MSTTSSFRLTPVTDVPTPDPATSNPGTSSTVQHRIEKALEAKREQVSSALRALVSSDN
jgi:hypothetical protein